MASLGSRRGPFKPGDLRPDGVRGPPMCLPPMAQRAPQAPGEWKPKRRDKAHEERLVLETAIEGPEKRSVRAVSPPRRASGGVTIPRADADADEQQPDRPSLALRLLRKGVVVAEVRAEPAMTVQELKESLAEILGTAAEDQRLFWRLRSLPDYSSLRACGLSSGEHELTLIPELSHRATGVAPICARRGMNMVPSGPSLPWKPSKYSMIRHEDLQLYFGDKPPLALDS
ncbi:unnamed protein product [Effrenium voratum]|nr:unnamed protein product [Effrenium voratum]